MKQVGVLGAGVLLVIAGTTSCDDIAQLNGSRAQESDPIEAEDRIEQQLGDLPATFDTTAASRMSGAFRAASARALPAVVQISTVAVTEMPTAFFPGFGPEMTPQRTQGFGSGFIFDERGYILTNHHVVRNALNVHVALLDGREFVAEVIGADPSTDVAVIRIDAANQELPVIELGESGKLRVGDWVIALGNPLGLTFTATAGIVSAKGRSIGILAEGAGETALEAFIQTDAAINPGNSGGPLVDLNGRVIGINTAIESPTGFFSGAGFAIPIDLARKVASDIVEYGTVHRPRLGVGISDVNAADAEVYGLSSITGVEVTQLTPGTPADRAGLQLGDVILTIDDEPVNSVPDLQARVAQYQPGERIALGFVRYGQAMRTTVELGQFEPPQVERPAARAVRDDANRLGFRVTTLPPNMRNAAYGGDEVPVVSEIDQLGPAYGSGLSRGHVIRRFNGQEIRSVRDLERAAASVQSGDVVSLIVVPVGVPEPLPTIVNYRLQ